MQSEILSGWKDIAKYFGNGVRTVQRYERELGLPVRRPVGKPQGSVIATKSELDAWVEARRSTENPQTLVASVLSACACLTYRVAEMRELANQTEKLILETRASCEMLRHPEKMLRDTVRNTHGDVHAGHNEATTNGLRLSTSHARDYRYPSKGAA